MNLNRMFARSLLALAAGGLAACSNDAAPVTSEMSNAKPASLTLTNSTPELGKIKICKLGNVNGTFTVNNTVVNGGTATVEGNPVTVVTGTCALIVTDLDVSGVGSNTTITETSAGFASATADFINNPGGPSNPAYTDGQTQLFANQFHGWTITYTNNVISPPPPPPPPTNVGCSPGYWKNHSNWPAPYSPSELFAAAGFDNAFPGKTLLQVLQTGGGGLTALGRQTVGALLNAARLAPWDLSAAQVKSQFNAAYPGTNGAYSTLQTTFENLTDVNGRTCPLN